MPFGIDPANGKSLTGWPKCRQLLMDFWTTPKGSRVLLRGYGSELPRMLGRPMNELLFVDLLMACSEVEPYVPNFQLRGIDIEAWEAGKAHIMAFGYFFPRGHLGDFSVAEKVEERIILA